MSSSSTSSYDRRRANPADSSSGSASMGSTPAVTPPVTVQTETPSEGLVGTLGTTSAITCGIPICTILIPPPGAANAPWFDGKDATEFLSRYQESVADYNIVEENVLQRMTRYCALSCCEYIISLPEYEANDGEGVVKAMKMTYAKCDTPQQQISRQYLEKYKNTTQDGRKNLQLYCQEFNVIVPQLRAAGQIDDYTAGLWFLEGLDPVLAAKLVKRTHVDIADASTLDFKKIVSAAAEHYDSEEILAYQNKPNWQKNDFPSPGSGNKNIPPLANLAQIDAAQQLYEPNGNGQQQQGTSQRGACHFCGQWVHYRQYCPRLGQMLSTNRIHMRDSSNIDIDSDSINLKRDFLCRQQYVFPLYLDMKVFVFYSKAYILIECIFNKQDSRFDSRSGF